MPHGSFVWYEHMTTDVAKAKDFYGKVVGWSFNDMPMPGDMGGTYTLIMDGDIQVAGMMSIPPGMEWPTCWQGHVGVDDVDASAAKAKALGATIYREPTDIPGIGRFAVIGDPQGAGIMMFKGADGSPPPCGDQSKLKHIGWRELMAVDMPKVWDFYEKLFGWTKGDGHDMGPMGIYQLFFGGGSAMPIGGMMTKPAEMPVPSWGYYFNVDGVGAAADRVKDAGGQVINGPHEVPGGMWIVQAVDCNGAHFGLLSTHK
jgi:hypothetical protein